MLGIFAGSVTLACFFAQAWRGLSLWDEGFLWYGVQRTLAGEVPMRDFMAYDPGRYYWSAIVMRWLGSDGIVALRASLAALQALAVFAGLWIVGRNSPRGTGAAWLLSVAALLAAWMTPDFKGGDFATALGLLAALAFLAERPTAKRHLLAGACTGLAAVMGRNHGLYGAAGALFAVWVLGRTHKSGGATSRGMGLWGIGVVAGYLPMVLMLFFCPGFAASLGEGIRFTFEIKATNLPVPVPWPWRAQGSLGFGTLVPAALKAAENLGATLADMRFVKPIDRELVLNLAARHDALVTLEEAAVMGGAGSAVAETLNQAGIAKPLLQLGLPDAFIDHGDQAALLAGLGLDAAGIEAAIRARFAAIL